MLLGLISVNLAVHWPWAERKHEMGRPPGPPPKGAEGPLSDEMRARMESALTKLPEAQQKAIRERIEADKAFFASIKNLSETERRQKMQEHFAQNPPPQIPGVEKMGPPPGMAGDPGKPGEGADSSSGSGNNEAKEDAPNGPESNRLPDPAVRRGLDQQIANSQKAPATPQ